MTADEILRLAYLGLLALAVTGWVFTEGARDIARSLRHMLVWCFVFLGAIGGYGLWTDIRKQGLGAQMVVAEGGRIEVPRSLDGHYYVTARIGGAPIDFIVDTGASDVVLTRADAARIGIDPDRLRFDGRAGTANGTVRTARIRVEEIRVGGVAERRVPVVINEGEMETSLLGMSFLGRFSRIEIADGTLVLER